MESYQKKDTIYLKPEFYEQNAVCNHKELQRRNPMFCTNSKGKKRIAVFHDSFTGALQPYLAETFAESYFFWRYPQKNLDADFIIGKADIVVLENVERLVHEISEY